MTTIEAKEILKQEFMARYYEWRKDIVELNDHDFGWKYGWQKSERTKSLKDNLSAVTVFQKYFYPCRTADKFAALGIDQRTVWDLSREGWLSETLSQKQRTRYFLSQQRSKEIWKEARDKN